MNFGVIANQLITEHFTNLSKAVDSLSDTARSEYASKFSVEKSIWIVGGITKETATAISQN